MNLKIKKNLSAIQSQAEPDSAPRLEQNLASVSEITDLSQLAADKIITSLENCFDKIVQDLNIENDLAVIKRWAQMSLDLSKRPEVFRKINLLLGSFLATSESNLSIYRMAFDITTAIKDQVEKRPQTQEEAAEIEWCEFQKSVYLLSDWEDGLFQNISLQNKKNIMLS